MAKKSGGGWAAIAYTLAMGRRVGFMPLWRAMRSKNACKTCALGMGGQLGGMRNEAGHWPEFCKKSLQAMVADMQGGIAPEFFRQASLAQLQTLSPRELESCGRIVTPLLAEPGATHYRAIDWAEATTRIAAKLRAILPNEAFFYFSGRSSNEAAFLLQLFARLYGTNNVNNCSYYCHQASGVGLSRSIGTGTATIALEDLDQCDLFLLIGGNPASNHPRLMRSLMGIRRRGGEVIVINPARELGLVNFSVPSDPRSLLFGSPIASQYVQPHIGGDIAVLTGVAKLLVERGQCDRAFIQSATEGSESFLESIRAVSWAEIVASAGVERREIEQIADRFAAARHVVIGWTMGITHHQHGVDNVRMIVNLALLRGMVGRSGAGLLPIRGHSNVQGIGSVGVTPVLREAIFQRLEQHFGVRLPSTPGLDTMGCMAAALEGRMRVGLCLGGNLFGSNPDAQRAHRALGQIDMVVYLSTTLNTGHAWGLGKETLILPVLARDEEPQPTTQESMFNYVRLSDGGVARHAGPRPEVAAIAAIAASVLESNSPIDWRSLEDHQALRAAIAAIIPGYEKIGTIDETKKEFQVAGRTLHKPVFATPSGKAQFAAVAIPNLPRPAGQLRLMTVRSEGQFNTVVYEEEDLYRGQDRRDVILLNPADMEMLGLQTDQPVMVRGPAGALEGIRARPFDIRAGNALMYYPEANVLVPSDVDPQSKTPAFKNILVSVEAMAPPRSPSPAASFVAADALARA